LPHTYRRDSPIYLLSFYIRPETCSTLFPYTSLFRSYMLKIFRYLVNFLLHTHQTLSRSSLKELRFVALFVVCRLLQIGAPLVKKDRKSTRLNSSHVSNSYAVFCLKQTSPKATTYSSS